MRVEKLAFNKTESFSKIFLDYIARQPKLEFSHAFEPSIKGFEQALAKRNLSENTRNNLVEVLTQQYKNISKSDAVAENIELLKDQKTFTVTTGHQLNIFTGPLFFVYKIVTTINICRELASKFPDYRFVPIYWMASEDHDFAEINHVVVDEHKYVWESSETGAVGRFSTKELADLADSIPGKIDVFKQAYTSSENLADAVRNYVNELFGESGLVVLDSDHKLLKDEFTSIIKDDLLEHTPFTKVNEGSQLLIEQGYKPQLSPREINLFYLDENLRSRIEKDGNSYKVVDTDLSFTKEEILDLLKTNPEKFSPNVILRPLYQEVILPNLGYIGGPAELAYWLQYKKMFDHYKIDFPVLMPRNFGLYLNQNAQRKKKSLGLVNEDLFLSADSLKKKYVQSNNGNIDLEKERKELLLQYESIKKLASAIDVTLAPYIEVEVTRLQKSIDRIEGKFVKAEKLQRSDEMNKIDSLKTYTFPGGTPQERIVNILSIASDAFLKDIDDLADPFDLRMHIFLE